MSEQDLFDFFETQVTKEELELELELAEQLYDDLAKGGEPEEEFYDSYIVGEIEWREKEAAEKLLRDQHSSNLLAYLRTIA